MEIHAGRSVQGAVQPLVLKLEARMRSGRALGTFSGPILTPAVGTLKGGALSPSKKARLEECAKMPVFSRWGSLRGVIPCTSPFPSPGYCRSRSGQKEPFALG